MWVALSRLWAEWRKSLVLVQPDTVIGWHRKGFGLYWNWKSRRGRIGRPGTAKEIRELIRNLSRSNVLWGAQPLASYYRYAQNNDFMYLTGYEAALAIHEANMKVYRPGLTLEQCRKEVGEILTRQGFDLTKDLFKRMRPGFGHYVGMATHDVGGGPQVLKPGMVFANEPYTTFRDENLGVRVEDTILITETGCENLAAGIPQLLKKENR